MALAVIDRYRQGRPHLFVEVDDVVAQAVKRIHQWRGEAQAFRVSEVIKDAPVIDAAKYLRELRRFFFIRFLTARGEYEDAFNVTQMWLDAHGFEYDDLIIVQKAEHKLAHLTYNSVLLDASSNANQEALKHRGGTFVPFLTGGSWLEILPHLQEKAGMSLG